MSVQSMGEMEKDFCPNFLQPFLENIDRRSCHDALLKCLVQSIHVYFFTHYPPLANFYHIKALLVCSCLKMSMWFLINLLMVRLGPRTNKNHVHIHTEP